jgi:hypothetical protein
LGLELAWQSIQEVGCGWLARVREEWNRAGVNPDWFVAQVAASAFEGLW